MDYPSLLASVDALLGRTDRAGEELPSEQEVPQLRAMLRRMSEIRNTAGCPHSPDVAGAAEDFAGQMTRRAKESLDAVDSGAKRTDDDITEGMKSGKFPKGTPEKPLTKDSLWYRWKVFYADWFKYLNSVTGPEGSGINVLNSGLVQANAEQWMKRLEGFRTEIAQVHKGALTPIGPLPAKPPDLIPDIPALPAFGGGTLFGVGLALAGVLLLKR